VCTGRRRACVACSKLYPRDKSFCSLNAGPKKEMPTGRLSPVNPAGTIRSGKPARLAMFVAEAVGCRPSNSRVSARNPGSPHSLAARLAPECAEFIIGPASGLRPDPVALSGLRGLRRGFTSRASSCRGIARGRPRSPGSRPGMRGRGRGEIGRGPGRDLLLVRAIDECLGDGAAVEGDEERPFGFSETASRCRRSRWPQTCGFDACNSAPARMTDLGHLRPSRTRPRRAGLPPTAEAHSICAS
jgi:hypothetical protein